MPSSSGHKSRTSSHVLLDGQTARHHFSENKILLIGAVGLGAYGMRWEGEWLDTSWPSFFVLSEEGFEVINWGLSIYKGCLFFGQDEAHSLIVGLGNISTYIGFNYERGIGMDASANVLEIGYDGRIIDASIEVLSVGITYMYKDGKLEFGTGAGWWGWSVSIDLLELFKLRFGGN